MIMNILAKHSMLPNDPLLLSSPKSRHKLCSILLHSQIFPKKFTELSSSYSRQLDFFNGTLSVFKHNFMNFLTILCVWEFERYPELSLIINWHFTFFETQKPFIHLSFSYSSVLISCVQYHNSFLEGAFFPSRKQNCMATRCSLKSAITENKVQVKWLSQKNSEARHNFLRWLHPVQHSCFFCTPS